MTQTPRQRFAVAVREHRRRGGLSQVELAARAGVTQGAVSEWETGTSAPGFDSLCALAGVLELSLDEVLLGRAGAGELLRLRRFRSEIAEALTNVEVA